MTIAAKKKAASVQPAKQAKAEGVHKNYQDRNLISKIWYGLHKLVDTSNLVLDRAYDVTDVGSSYAITELELLKKEAT